MGWMADGGASTGTGRIEYPRERVRCHAAVLCCAAGHLLQYRARQGSTGGSEETHLAHSIEHMYLWHPTPLLLIRNYKALRDTWIFKLLDQMLLQGREFASLPPLSSVCKGILAALRAIHHVTGSRYIPTAKSGHMLWHSSVDCSPIASMYCQVPLLWGLPHSDVLNPARAVLSSSYTVPTKQQTDYTLN